MLMVRYLAAFVFGLLSIKRVDGFTYPPSSFGSVAFPTSAMARNIKVASWRKYRYPLMANELAEVDKRIKTSLSNSKKTSIDDNDTSSSNSIEKKKNDLKQYLLPIGIVAALGAVALGVNHAVDFEALFQHTVDKVEELGPLGYVYFAAIYIAAEILAVPAFPLTASSGYLFGLLPGTLLVLSSATVAASISFLLGRNFLKTWAQRVTSESPLWQGIDKAISKEGFKVILLLRLSPLLPFALSNYLYGVTSVDFWSFITATFIGFAPGSFGFVYFGSAGKALATEGLRSSIPWYGYAAIGALVIFLGQTVAKVATDAVKNIQEAEAALADGSDTPPK